MTSKPQRIANVALVVFFLGAGLVAVVGFSRSTATLPAAQSPTDSVDPVRAKQLIDQSVAAGYIPRWSCTGHTADVAPAMWLKLDAQEKRGLVLALARLCVDQRAGDRMTVNDAQSGRRLAHYAGGAVSFER
jgi:hypothetical protein